MGLCALEDTYKFYARVNYPTEEAAKAITQRATQSPENRHEHEEELTYKQKISVLVDDKFEFIAGHQTYGDWLGKPFGTAQAQSVSDMHRLLRMYPTMKLAYLHNPGKGIDSYAGVLAVYVNREKADKIRERESREIAAGTRDKDNSDIMHSFEGNGSVVRVRHIKLYSHYLAGQGKPVNQNNLLKFVTGEFTQLIDINQDFYQEETFKMPNLVQEFRKDPDVTIVGFP